MDKKKKGDRNKRPDMYGKDQGIYKKNRAIIRRTAEYCAICGGYIDKSLKFPDPYSLTIDHIIPISKGGKSTMNNLQPAHLMCNSLKGSKLEYNAQKERKVKGKSLPQYIDWKNYTN